MANLEDKKRL